MSRKVRLALSGACALLAVVCCLAYGQQTRSQAEHERAEAIARYGGEVTRVVVASRALEAGDVINWQNATEKDWVADLVPTGALTSLDDAMGRTVTEPAAAGAALCAVNFRDAEGSSEAPEGYVTVSLAASEKLGLPDTAKVGTRLAAYRVVDSTARLVTADLQVLAVSGETSALGARGTVCLAARANDVPELLVAGSEGSLRLVVPATKTPEEKDADDSKADTSTATPTKVEAEKGDKKTGDAAKTDGTAKTDDSAKTGASAKTEKKDADSGGGAADAAAEDDEATGGE